MPLDSPAAVGRGVYVSNVGFCDRGGRDYDLRIHIYRDSQTDAERCAAVRSRGADAGLLVRYTEGDGLGRLSVPLEEIVAYARQPGRLLVHCQYGMYRAVMLAMVSLVARGATPFEAVAAVLEGQWRDRGVALFAADQPLCDLLRWWEAHQRDARTSAG